MWDLCYGSRVFENRVFGKEKLSHRESFLFTRRIDTIGTLRPCH